MTSQNVPDSDFYNCPNCNYVGRDDENDDTGTTFWEKGDDLWDCPNCKKRITIIPNSIQSDVSCCVSIRGIISLGTTYKVLNWLQNEFSIDPTIICDDGEIRLMWRGLFHD